MPIQIVAQTDSICDPCPNRLGTTCRTDEIIATLDNAHANTLNLQPGQTVTWGEAKELIATKLTLAKQDEICATCGWKKYGICASVLREFLHERC